MNWLIEFRDLSLRYRFQTLQICPKTRIFLIILNLQALPPPTRFHTIRSKLKPRDILIGAEVVVGRRRENRLAPENFWNVLSLTLEYFDSDCAGR